MPCRLLLVQGQYRYIAGLRYAFGPAFMEQVLEESVLFRNDQQPVDLMIDDKLRNGIFYVLVDKRVVRGIEVMQLVGEQSRHGFGMLRFVYMYYFQAGSIHLVQPDHDFRYRGLLVYLLVIGGEGYFPDRLPGSFCRYS